MSVGYKKNGTETEYTVCYRNMGGVDFTSENNPSNRSRFSYLENMYRDYEGDGGIMLESVPGFRKIARASNSGKVHSIFSYKDSGRREHLVIHAGEALYKMPIDEKDGEEKALSPIATLASSKSSAFKVGNSLYILDGKNITVLDGDGNVTSVNDNNSLAYRPTCYVNGEEYEQRNLLTDRFIEKYRIGKCDDMQKETPGLKYTILSEGDKTCEVSDVTLDLPWIHVYIPPYTIINGEAYKVVAIGDRSFWGCEQLLALTVAEGIVRIGKSAFLGCTHLVKAILPESVEELDDAAFDSCKSLNHLNFGKSLKRVGMDALCSCRSLENIYYSGSRMEFESIQKDTEITQTITYSTSNTCALVTIPIFSPSTDITRITTDTVSDVEFLVSYKSTRVLEVTVFTVNKQRFDNQEFSIYGILSDTGFNTSPHGTSFYGEHGVNGKEAILGCTLCESFDGRIFLSGNPSLPNTVFYSQRDKSGKNNPLYFGLLNYFNDGIGTNGVISLLAVKDTLAVFKDGDDAGGSIYYHKPNDTGIDILPKVYPVSYVHNGISAKGKTISFFDDPLFISRLGLVSINQNTYSGEKKIEVRSHNVNTKLLSENLRDISLASWMGYLVIGAGERIYLADSRQRFRHASGNYEYEWYFLNGIASYYDDEIVYRYSDTAPSGYDIHENTDGVAMGEIISYYSEAEGEKRFYSREGDKRYTVYVSDERVGGQKHPMTALYSHNEELLFFGTDNGDICIFNNDKRGVAPARISEKAEFNNEEYQKSFSRKIHSDYYSFANHAVRYVARTVMDNVDVPHLSKSTVKNSLTAKLRLYSNTDVKFEVKTDKSDYTELSQIPDTIPDFEDFDFSALSFISSDYSTVAIKEKEKDWIEKQLQVSSDKFRSPFGLCSQAYRYTIKGRIKNI